MMPAPSPAPRSTMTRWPEPTSIRTPPGTMPTRYSSFLISLGTPTIIATSSTGARLHHKRLSFEPREPRLVPGPEDELGDQVVRVVRELGVAQPLLAQILLAVDVGVRAPGVPAKFLVDHRRAPGKFRVCLLHVDHSSIGIKRLPQAEGHHPPVH